MYCYYHKFKFDDFAICLSPFPRIKVFVMLQKHSVLRRGAFGERVELHSWGLVRGREHHGGKCGGKGYLSRGTNSLKWWYSFQEWKNLPTWLPKSRNLVKSNMCKEGKVFSLLVWLEKDRWKHQGCQVRSWIITIIIKILNLMYNNTKMRMNLFLALYEAVRVVFFFEFCVVEWEMMICELWCFLEALRSIAFYR